MGQVATPVVGSITRNEGQPFVLQKRRWLPLAAEARRRIRRILLARPITDVVTERDIMGLELLVLSGAPDGVMGHRPRPVY
jgi:hypothetical protein